MSEPTRPVCSHCHEHEQPVDPAARKGSYREIHRGHYYCFHRLARETRAVRDDGATVITRACVDCPRVAETVLPLPVCEPADKRVADLREQLTNAEHGAAVAREERDRAMEERDRALAALDEGGESLMEDAF